MLYPYQHVSRETLARTRNACKASPNKTRAVLIRRRAHTARTTCTATDDPSASIFLRQMRCRSSDEASDGKKASNSEARSRALHAPTSRRKHSPYRAPGYRRARFRLHAKSLPERRDDFRIRLLFAISSEQADQGARKGRQSRA